MYWIDNATGVAAPPAIPSVISATKLNFTEGGPGQQPSIPGAEWFNMLTDEGLSILSEAGITPDKSSHSQLAEAIKVIAANNSPGRLLGVRVFTSSGTYTPTPGTNSIVVECVGGGGGGGGAVAAGSGQVSAGGNGGGGAYAKGRFTSGFSGLPITIGIGGALGGNGGPGGTTSLGSLISAGGGAGGGAGVPFSPPGSSGGQAAGGSVITGGNIVTSLGFTSDATVAISTSTIFNVKGAPSMLGPGPSGGVGHGVSAVTKGAGGSGALANPSSGPYNGGAGAPGVLIIWEYR